MSKKAVWTKKILQNEVIRYKVNDIGKKYCLEIGAWTVTFRTQQNRCQHNWVLNYIEVIIRPSFYIIINSPAFCVFHYIFGLFEKNVNNDDYRLSFFMEHDLNSVNRNIWKKVDNLWPFKPPLSKFKFNSKK